MDESIFKPNYTTFLSKKDVFTYLSKTNLFSSKN